MGTNYYGLKKRYKKFSKGRAERSADIQARKEVLKEKYKTAAFAAEVREVRKKAQRDVQKKYKPRGGVTQNIREIRTGIRPYRKFKRRKPDVVYKPRKQFIYVKASARPKRKKKQRPPAYNPTGWL